MSDHATALAIPELETLGSPHVTIRIGRQGKTWHAVASIETGQGPILLHARADQGAVLRAILHNAHLRRWVERISRGTIAPGALDKLAAQIGFEFPNPFKALSQCKPLAKIVQNIAHGQVLRDVTRKVGQVASRIPAQAAKLGQSALGHVVKHPLWDMARTGLSFVPGLGTGISSGMAAVAAFGRGQSAQDIALAAARGALPGGDLAKLAWDLGVGLGKHPRLDASAVRLAQKELANLVASRLGAVPAALFKQATSGDPWIGAAPAAMPRATLDAAQAAFKAGLAVSRTKGQPLNRSNISALEQALPRTPVGAKIGRLASDAMVQSHYRSRAVIAYKAALNVIQRLEEQDPLAFAEIRQLQSQAAQGNPKSRTALAVLEVTRRAKVMRTAMPAPSTPPPSLATQTG